MSESRAKHLLVCIHGWPVTAYHWRFISPLMERLGYRVKCITPRGLGTAAPSELPYDKASLAEEILEQLNAENINSFVLVGHDWGGTIGYLIAKKAGPRCQALIIEEEILPCIDVNIPSPGSLYYPQWHGSFNRSVGLGEALIPGNEHAYYSQFLEESSGRNPICSDSIENYLKAYCTPNPLKSTLAYYRTVDADIKQIHAASLAKMDTPILSIGGRYGMGPAVGLGMKHVGNNVSTVVLPESGHYPAEQEPKQFSEAVHNFLSNHL